MSLRESQQALQRQLTGPADVNVEAAAHRLIVAAPPLGTAERLGIYGHAYRARLIAALDDTYPTLRKVLGDDDLVALGEAFIAAQPSSHRSIRWYGRELPQFLATHSPYDEQPVIGELALLEWTLSEVFDAADAIPVDRSALAEVRPDAWGQLRFGFHPSLRRLALGWNAVSVYQALNRDTPPPDPEASPQPVHWVLWRRDLVNYFRSMDPLETAALDAAARGQTFGAICGALQEWLPDNAVPLRAATLIGSWTDSGLLVGLDAG